MCCELMIANKIIRNKLEEFNRDLSVNSINYILDEGIYLVFDYEYIDRKIEEIFDEYDVDIFKENESCFDIVIKMKSGFVIKKIRENYKLMRGDNYEHFY
jgi:hypothetical protein